MARGRLLCNTLSTSEKFNALYGLYPLHEAEFFQNVYMITMTHVDDCGRFPGDAQTVKAKVLPLNPRDVQDFDRALEALDRVELIHRYTIDRRQFLFFTDFEKYQELRHPPRSVIPAPPTSPVLPPSVPEVARDGPAMPPCGHGIARDTPGHVPPKEEKEEKKDHARWRARRSLTSSDYLAACTHTPHCETSRLCGDRRRLDAAVRDKVVALEQAERLVGLLVAERQLLRATPARKVESS